MSESAGAAVMGRCSHTAAATARIATAAIAMIRLERFTRGVGSIRAHRNWGIQGRLAA
jgi:hypothetical protein